MKSKIMFSVLLVAGLLFAASATNNLSAQTAKVKTEMVKAKKYYCPHHPDQVSDKPGKCPVCGMALVEMTDKVQDMKTMKMDKNMMKGDMKKMDHSKKMMKDSAEMKMNKMENKVDTMKMMKKKL